jgi:Transglycosylase SLT domain
MPSYDLMIRSILVVLLSLPGPSVASADIPPAYAAVAASHGIPADLFYAVALTESGRALPSISVTRPWPWSANFGGRGQYFASRREAQRAIEDYLRSGRRSVDIGLMQISWRYHKDKLGSVWHALDPHSNLNEAAKILIWCNAQHRDWWLSVGCYHAPSNKAHALQYQERVRKHWSGLER